MRALRLLLGVSFVAALLRPCGLLVACDVHPVCSHSQVTAFETHVVVRVRDPRKVTLSHGDGRPLLPAASQPAQAPFASGEPGAYLPGKMSGAELGTDPSADHFELVLCPRLDHALRGATAIAAACDSERSEPHLRLSTPWTNVVEVRQDSEDDTLDFGAGLCPKHRRSVVIR
jgi:hypothetical protein